MPVFVAGATGVLGRRVVKKLVAGGHAVAGLSRSQPNAEWLAQHGAEPKSGDLINAAQLAELSAGGEAGLHLAAAIPTQARTRRGDRVLNDRIRTVGTRALAVLDGHTDGVTSVIFASSGRSIFSGSDGSVRPASGTSRSRSQ